MFFAVRIGAPRRTVSWGATAEGSGRSEGLGALADRPAPVPGVEGDSLVGLTDSTVGWFPSWRVAAGSFAAGECSCDGGESETAGLVDVFPVVEVSPAKKIRQDSSTEDGSFSQASLISSISQEFAPNASFESGVDIFASGCCHDPLT